MVQKYKDNNYLTFWAGNNAAGAYYIVLLFLLPLPGSMLTAEQLDETYSLTRKFDVGHELGATCTSSGSRTRTPPC